MLIKNLRILACLPKEAMMKKKSGLSTKLEPIGIFEPTCDDSNYSTGQLFLHKVFGYRGIILTPWEVRVFDRDETLAQSYRTAPASSSKSKTDRSANTDDSLGDNILHLNGSATYHQTNKTALPQTKTRLYYSVLMDERDWKHVKYRTQTEGVTFLHESEENSPFFTIPGLDYVSHTDIMPYSSLSVKPIQHNLLDKFISYEPTTEPPFVARHALKEWTARNKFWLEPTDVYKETTNDIRVTVIPFYMGCKRKPSSGDSTANNSTLALHNYSGAVQQYWWRYCIRLENMGTHNVQLCERNWRIFSMNGSLETVRARGVNGVEPLLSMDMPAFQYSSHVSLYTPSGHMWGTFRIRTRSGKSFDVKVPPFTLESKTASSKDYSPDDDGGSRPPPPPPPSTSEPDSPGP
ncbi:polymerase delta-interacting protein 2-like [Convolutriloba macropyga]|uniref:polymerase delta-interacting protein 2-like n=1 Tax=Convolutriloba macropyga TaxID=536237 RepID=UPI003F51B0D3